ncbi:MAG TPA: recombination protein RecR [Hellea balneolensis]|uniref:Recombination protein RecR n=1 Tax=Hellea balneolensis TaxID=287478 RepID=A0A7C5LU13_9PROT|nr:recombination protein RecR [Hellea balneolensis]
MPNPPRLGGSEIDTLIKLLAKLPGLGPRSARRAALTLVKKREQLLLPLARALFEAGEKIKTCTTCGNIDVTDPCHICTAPGRTQSAICVVQDIGDLWAMERAGAFRGLYHVIGGCLSAIDGIRPEHLNIEALITRAMDENVEEIVLAMNATVDGQTTAYYITDHLEQANVKVTRLAHGVPVGGELDYLDDGTISAAMQRRQPF